MPARRRAPAWTTRRPGPREGCWPPASCISTSTAARSRAVVRTWWPAMPSSSPATPAPACASRATPMSAAHASTTSAWASGARRRCAGRCCCRAPVTRRSQRSATARSARRSRATTKRPGPRTGASRSFTWQRLRALPSPDTESLMPAVLAALVMLALLAGCATSPSEDDPAQLKVNDLEARVGRLERSNANQVALAQHQDEVQATLRELQGRIEELEHSNEALAKQQRDLYADLDKRLGGGAAGAAGAAAGVAAGAAAGSAGSAQPEGPSSTEQAVYAQAFDALKAGSYSIAITGFKDFLGTYPTSSLAENAQYWLGEAYYVNHDYDAAGGAFRSVLKKWPDSNKAPDALLKLGYTQFAQKQFPAAKATLTEVTRKYPGTDAARLAADRLKRIPAQ